MIRRSHRQKNVLIIFFFVFEIFANALKQDVFLKWAEILPTRLWDNVED
jgi:hypothetical protein